MSKFAYWMSGIAGYAIAWGLTQHLWGHDIPTNTTGLFIHDTLLVAIWTGLGLLFAPRIVRDEK